MCTLECPEEYKDGVCLRCADAGFECVLDHTSTASRVQFKPSFSPKRPIDHPPHFFQPSETPPAVPIQSPLQLPSVCSLGIEEDAISTTSHTREISAHPKLVFTELDTDFQLSDMFPSPDSFEMPAWLSSAFQDTVLSSGYGSLARLDDTMADLSEPLTVFYHNIIVGWFSPLPDHLRRQLIHHYSQISGIHQITRAARNAVSAAYLSRIRARSRQYGGAFLCKRGPNNQAVPLVPSCCLSHEADPHFLYKEAIRLLETAPADTSTLEARIWAVMDLQLYELAYSGARRSYTMLARADDLVHAAFGPNPSLDLASLSGYSTFSLRVFALADIVRSIALRLPTTFSLIYQPAQQTSDIQEELWAYDNFLGLPQSFCHIMCRVTNLCAASRRNNGPIAQGLRNQVSDLEREIKHWRPMPFNSDEPLQSAHLIERAAMQECWRLSATILLYTIVLRLGPFHPVVLDAMSQVLALLNTSLILSATQEPVSVDLAACFSGWFASFGANFSDSPVCPAFLVGALSTRVEDRSLCRRYIQSCGVERVWEDDLLVLEKTWARADASGFPQDWFEVAQQDDLVVAFF